jgi:TRAP-type uncharacterized transport system fused permease subunit
MALIDRVSNRPAGRPRVILVPVLEATRRAVGWWLPGITVVFVGYAFLGPWMPELFSHRGYSLRRVIGHLYLTTEGIFGIPLGVSSTFVFAFVLFGAVLERTGAGEYLIRIAFSLVGHTRGGPAKVAWWPPPSWERSPARPSPTPRPSARSRSR